MNSFEYNLYLLFIIIPAIYLESLGGMMGGYLEPPGRINTQ